MVAPKIGPILSKVSRVARDDLSEAKTQVVTSSPRPIQTFTPRWAYAPWATACSGDGCGHHPQASTPSRRGESRQGGTDGGPVSFGLSPVLRKSTEA